MFYSIKHLICFFLSCFSGFIVLCAKSLLLGEFILSIIVHSHFMKKKLFSLFKKLVYKSKHTNTHTHRFTKKKAQNYGNADVMQMKSKFFVGQISSCRGL